MVNVEESEMHEGEEFSDNEGVDEKRHEKLAAAVAELGSKRRIKPAVRNELGSQISEYHVKSNHNRNNVSTSELADVLGGKGKFSAIDKKVRKVTGKAVTLPKPLEKPVADKIKRKVGFAVVKEQLKKWEPVVTRNRIADHLDFPLNEPKLTFGSCNDFFEGFITKPDVVKELEEIEFNERQAAAAAAEEKEKDDFPLTLDEMMHRRKEMAHLRARQSYKEARLHRQSKIKSKKYHRIRKREKVRQEIKDFEALQKTDPESALKKLEEIEKVRAEERANLRHRSTGKWAKNLAVRAKYDKDTRKVLSEQLAISRDLTAKARTEDSSDEDTGEPNPGVLKTAIDIAESNPWSLEVSAEVNEFIRGVKDYWKNKSDGTTSDSTTKKISKNETATIGNKSKHLGETTDKTKTGASGKWVVADLSEQQQGNDQVKVDDILYLKDKKLAKTAIEKFKPLAGKIKPLLKEKKRKNKNAKPDVTMKKSRWQVDRAEVDQELGDMANEEVEPVLEESTVAIDSPKDVPAAKPATSLNIDPDKFLKVKPKVIKTPLPDDVSDGEEGLDDVKKDDQTKFVMEAFADDNVVAEFEEMKKTAEKETEPEVVQELPGWGQWGGVGVRINNRRKKRRFLQIGQLPARKDQGRRDVIINEEANPSIKNHMVKEVPFPFKSVDAFEANIRAPISREWVPEKSHRSLIKPRVRTRQGTIIEPMSDEVLLRNQPRQKSLFKGKKKELRSK